GSRARRSRATTPRRRRRTRYGCKAVRRSGLGSALAERPQAQPQRVQLDEALGVALVVGALIFFEGHMLHGVERLRRLAANNGSVALVELEPHRAGDILLAPVDQRLQHLALGRIPEAVVDQLGVFRHQLVLEVRRSAIERDGLDAAMSGVEDG